MDMVVSVDQLPHVGETRLASELAYYPGGKGANQAIAAARSAPQETDIHFFGCVGKDVFGDRLVQTLAQEKIDVTGVERSSLPTGCASIWVDQQGENSILVVPGANQALQAAHVPAHLLTSQTVLVLQMEVPLEENWRLVKRAAESGTRIILNCAPAASVPSEILDCLEGLILNEEEARLLGESLREEGTSLAKWAQKMAQRYSLWVVVTRGKKGALLCTAHETWEAPALLISPQDTTAAGDTFVGVFASFLSFGYSLSECLHDAVAASGLACLKKGAIPSIPDYSAILEARRELLISIQRR